MKNLLPGFAVLGKPGALGEELESLDVEIKSHICSSFYLRVVRVEVDFEVVAASVGASAPSAY